MTVVSLRDVIKRSINGEKVVNGANLSVDDGEIVAVLGAEGSGKGTLLDLIAGRLKASAGEIRIRGVVANKVPQRDRDVAMVRGYSLYPNMTVRANLAFPLRLSKVPGHEVRERVERVAAELGLTDLLELKPRELSGLDRQLVTIGRALVRDPGVLLVDAPPAGAGPAERDQLHSVLGRLRDQGLAAVYATGDPNEAVSLADRVAVMADGAIDQVGPSAALIDHPATLNVATFLSAPGTSFLPGQLDGDVLRSEFGDFLLPTALRVPTGRSAGQHVVMRIADPQGLATNAPQVLGMAAPTDVLASDGLILPYTVDRLTAHAAPNHAVPLPYSFDDLQLFDTSTGYNLTDPFAWATSGSTADRAAVDESAEASPTGRLPERHANAWLQDAELPLLVNEAAKVGFNIGGPRAEAIASAVFSEPDWGEASHLKLLVMLWAGRATVDPAGRELSLTRNGQTDDIWFEVTPIAAGKLRLRFRVYLAAQGILLQELRVDVPVVRQPRQSVRKPRVAIA